MQTLRYLINLIYLLLFIIYKKQNVVKGRMLGMSLECINSTSNYILGASCPTLSLISTWVLHNIGKLQQWWMWQDMTGSCQKNVAFVQMCCNNLCVCDLDRENVLCFIVKFRAWRINHIIWTAYAGYWCDTASLRNFKEDEYVFKIL